MKGRYLNRRKFFTLMSAGGAALSVNPRFGLSSENQQIKTKPSTNITDALKSPRKPDSMPGKYPGRVILVHNPAAVVNDVPVDEVAYNMIRKAMLELTGQKNLKKAWRTFVKPVHFMIKRESSMGKIILIRSGSTGLM